MKILSDLYFGNINPNERFIKHGSKVEELVKLISANEEALTESLNEKQKDRFEKFKDCTNELSCITESEAFTSGFILATRIMMQVTEGLQDIKDI